MSVLGWRQWAVDRAGLLRPAWTPWSPHPPELMLWRPDGVTRAHCLRGPHEQPASAEAEAAEACETAAAGATGSAGATGPSGETGFGGRLPEAGCACGLYAWRSPAELAAAPHPRWTSLPIVVGVARLGGRIIVGERGYRAELGYPVAVLDPTGVVAAVYQLARYRDRRALVAEWRPDASPEAA